MKCKRAKEGKNLLYLARGGIISGNRRCIEFLRSYQLLARKATCHKCKQQMTEEKCIGTMDGFRWRCSTSKCETTMTIRKRSLFEKSKIELPKLMMMIYLWTIDVSQRQIAFEANVSTRTMVNWTKKLRRVCSSEIKRKGTKIGGVSNGKPHVCQLDETFVAKRKPGNPRGRPVRQRWIMAGIDVETREMFAELVPEEGRKTAILSGIIMKYVRKGSIIWTDSFASYRKLESLGMDYKHSVINHHREYIGENGVNTQLIEVSWNFFKSAIRRLNGVPRSLIPQYIHEWLWKREVALEERFQRFLEIIASDPSFNTL